MANDKEFSYRIEKDRVSVHYCGHAHRTIYIKLDEPLLAINIGCFTGNKDKAIKRIRNEYESHPRDMKKYIQKVEFCFKLVDVARNLKKGKTELYNYSASIFDYIFALISFVSIMIFNEYIKDNETINEAIEQIASDNGIVLTVILLSFCNLSIVYIYRAIKFIGED